MTSNELLLAFVVVYIVGAVWALQRWGRKPKTVAKKPSFHDQVMDELNRFNEAIERGAKRQAGQASAAANFIDNESHTISPSVLGSDQP